MAENANWKTNQENDVLSFLFVRVQVQIPQPTFQHSSPSIFFLLKYETSRSLYILIQSK